ncbi:unnamed protein product [Spirodela intermedia]|uniref:Reverse transcriptase Ty1/copia-type domain-containing protein n=2 Tax=Spirodela intermedia TaxID=51605 RepID=A0A7I8J4Q5_SPIIN|nr:unnamed protein product [Spirodela intermedia]CAA6665218.1 unnamed protein product [Spirodela intermedia]
MVNYLSYDRLTPSYKAFLMSLKTIIIPKTIEEALSHKEWSHVMDEEIDALEKNCTWDLVPLPSGKKVVGCKWVYTPKYKADGTLERYKVRLVAKGYSQSFGIDYFEMFAPVAKLNTIRILIALAVNLE